MADDKTFTQADIDAAVEKAVGPLKSKIEEVMDEAKEAKRKLRAASEIKPEDLTAAEERADKAEAKVKELETANKALAKERDGAVKSLEAEQGAARSYALDAEINAAISAGGVVPSLVPGFTALMKQGAKAELVDGRYVVTIADKPAGEHISAFLSTDDGKHYKAAPMNGGGGAPGGGGAGGGKTITSADFNALDAKGRAAKMADGYSIADAA